MTLSVFKASLSSDTPPAEISKPLRALWEDARGNWETAHALAQDVPDESGAWVHAYLHRKEGDQANAAYWYRRARQPVAHDSLESEWQRIVTQLLDGD